MELRNHMSVELINEATLISRKYSKEFWETALQLALSYGWRPLGTRSPTTGSLRGWRELWTGTYLTNDAQTVLCEDARSLANALERSLDDLSDENPEMDWNPKSWREEDDLPDWFSPEEREIIEDGLRAHAREVIKMNPVEFFAGDEKENLKRFIRFCRLGSFIIM